MMDREFEPVKDLVSPVEINMTAAREHVGLIGQRTWVIKENHKSLHWSSYVLKHTIYGTKTHCVHCDMLAEHFPEYVWGVVFFSKGSNYGVNHWLQMQLQGSSWHVRRSTYWCRYHQQKHKMPTKLCLFGPPGEPSRIHQLFCNWYAVIGIQRFDVLLYPDALLKKVENSGRCKKQAISRGRHCFTEKARKMIGILPSWQICKWTTSNQNWNTQILYQK